MRSENEDILLCLLADGETGNSGQAADGAALHDALGMELLLQATLTSDAVLRKSQDRLLAKAVLREAHWSWRRNRWTASRLVRWAAAALVVMCVGGGLALRNGLWNRYPTPFARGDFRLLGPDGEAANRTAPHRGDRLVAGPAGAGLALGGYCELTLDADADIVIGGDNGNEQIELMYGRVVSRVAPGQGDYCVVTPRGTLDVRGTEFVTTVTYPEKKGAEAMDMKRATVTVMVLAGMVGFDFGPERGVLSMGGSRVFAAEEEVASGLPSELRGFLGIISGSVVEKVENGIALRVGKIEKTWPRNKAENPAGAVGKIVILRVIPEKQRDMAERMATLKVGADVAAGGAHREGNFLALVELLVPAAELPALQERWEAHAREREAREARAREERERRSNVGEGEGEREKGRGDMEAEIRRLREENARLKRLLEARRD